MLPTVTEEGLGVTRVVVVRVLTVTVTGLEVTLTGDPELSVTCSSKDQAPVADSIPVEEDIGETQDEELPRLV